MIRKRKVVLAFVSIYSKTKQNEDFVSFCFIFVGFRNIPLIKSILVKISLLLLFFTDVFIFFYNLVQISAIDFLKVSYFTDKLMIGLTLKREILNN